MEDAEEDAVWLRVAEEFNLLNRFEKNVSRATPEFIEVANSIDDKVFFDHTIPCKFQMSPLTLLKTDLKPWYSR
jgi:hypothetical protein